MVFNATFNNISVISWGSVLLVEEIGENHRPVTNRLSSVLFFPIFSFFSPVQKKRKKRMDNENSESCGFSS
jgi:hypothetical protein